MAGGLHKNALEINNHIPVALGPYADTAALTAAADAVVGDIGKLALQTDTGQLWRMTGFGPVTWEKVDTSAVHVDSDAEISAIADKAAPLGADYLIGEDSAAGDAKFSASITNVVAAAPPQAHGASHTDGTDDAPDVVGDSGAGGTHGLVPAAGAGDAAALKYLMASGAFVQPDHGGLLGNGDDDHTQYSLVDGTRAFSGVVAGVSPVAGADLATRQFTENAIAAAVDGGVAKENVDAATTAALPANTRTGDVLKGDAVGAFPTIDGIPPAPNRAYLVKDEGGGASHINDGIYELTVEGDGGTEFELTRRSDLDNGDDAAGAFVAVEAGTLNGDRTFRCINNAGSDVVNTDALQFNYWGQTVDHGQLIGLGDDDHAQYHNDARGDARYFKKTEALDVSAGGGDAGKPIKLDGNGEIAPTMIPDHASTHELAGADVMSVAGLSGELADDQPPKDHAASHEKTGGDELDVTNLSGKLADAQIPDAIIYFDPAVGASIGNRLKTWAEVEAATLPAPFITEIVFVGACPIPGAATLDVSRTIWSGLVNSPATVTIANGAAFTGIPMLIRGQCTVACDGAASPFTIAGTMFTEVATGSTIKSNGGKAPLLDSTAPGAALILLLGASCTVGNGVDPVVACAAAGGATFSPTGGDATIAADAVSGAPGSSLQIAGDWPTLNLGVQATFTGTLTRNTSGAGAERVGYDKAADVVIAAAVNAQAAVKELDAAVGANITAIGLNTTHAGLTDNPHVVYVTQEMHKVDAAEVIAGFFTLTAIPNEGDAVTVDKVTGIRQVNKQVVGATGATPDFDVGQEGGDDDDISINNAGGAAALSQTIIEDDVLIICYTV